MNQKEKNRLMKKFRLNSVSGGTWGEGFFEGLSWAESIYDPALKKSQSSSKLTGRLIKSKTSK